MMRGENAAPLAPDVYKHDLLAELPILRKIADIETRILFNLDSSNLQPHHWVELAATVHEALHFFADANTARRRLLLPLLTKSA